MSEILRTLGFYEPFCTLMLHGKIETRWVRAGRKPPFPVGKYLLYTTKQAAGEKTFDWCTSENIISMNEICKDEKRNMNGFALCVGELVDMWVMKPEDEGRAFVKFVGEKEFAVNKTIAGIQTSLPVVVKKVQWCLRFKNVQRIIPFEFKFGKQGVGILPDSEKNKIQIHE